MPDTLMTQTTTATPEARLGLDQSKGELPRRPQ